MPFSALLVPFVPLPDVTDGVLDELAGLFADVVPFAFRLDEVSQFPDGPVYLSPDPAAPFRHLVQELARAFPEQPSSEGRFDDVVPHLTVPLRDGEAMADVQRLVADHEAEHGAAQGYASEAQLVWVDDAAVEVAARFPFGTAAA